MNNGSSTKMRHMLVKIKRKKKEKIFALSVGFCSIIRASECRNKPSGDPHWLPHFFWGHKFLSAFDAFDWMYSMSGFRFHVAELHDAEFNSAEFEG